MKFFGFVPLVVIQHRNCEKFTKLLDLRGSMVRFLKDEYCRSAFCKLWDETIGRSQLARFFFFLATSWIF